MQQNMQHIRVRAVIIAAYAAVLAALSPAALAASGANEEAGVPAQVAAARALFRPENAVGAAPRAAQRPSPATAAADVADLAAQRGGTDAHNDMRLDGTVGANAATNVVSGSNAIDAGSFANMAGIPVVIQNTGSNVLIQSATIINLQFK